MDDTELQRDRAIRRLEDIEDELARVGGMEDFRERLSQIRMDLVDAGLEEAMRSGEVPGTIEEFGELEWRRIHSAVCWDAADRMKRDSGDDERVSYLWELADVIAEEKGVSHGR